MDHDSLSLGFQMPLQASNAGLFVSRGQGIHPDRVIPTFELIFVKEGCLSMEEEGHPFDIREGETLLLWPGRRHRGLQPYAPGLSFYWVHFGLRDLPHDEMALTVPQHAAVGRPDHLALLFRRLIDDQETLGIRPLSASLTVLLMLQEVTAPGRARTNSNSSVTLLAGRADSIIHSRFHEGLTASSLANELSCHPDYLGRAFRQTYNLTLTEAIHRRRLRQARSLLLESADAVDVVARSCGFEEVGYFRRLFKRQEGLSPSAFRQIYSRLHVNTG
ncbi:AraC family transcriptional regulator [Deinococcus altitudinis]|uniref:helix-turn-helix transcriptional regulator n=1 Tax=Deinococcus altitudinis TaxID=468914 RepID=UPI003892869D